MKIAICYDRVTTFGGAERVLLVLKELFPQAPLFTLSYNSRCAHWADGWDIRTSFLQHIPVLKHFYRLFAPFAHLAWEQFDFSGFDVVLSVTSGEAKSILVPVGSTHICYCLTPTRYYWSGYYDYLRSPGLGRLDFIVRRVFPFFAHIFRVYDYYLAQRPHVMIGISEEVCRRIRSYYRRDALCLYPPVSFPSSVIKRTYEHFLVVSRLVPYKRVDIVIEAFSRLHWPLVVVGDGSQRLFLERLAADCVRFTGFVPDSELSAFYFSSVAVVFPTYEDFGIVPVEAQAHGVPVVAYRGGGVLETVSEGVTGVFFNEQTVDSLFDLLLRVSNSGNFHDACTYFSQFSLEACVDNVRRFSKDVFKEKLLRILSTVSSS